MVTLLPNVATPGEVGGSTFYPVQVIAAFLNVPEGYTNKLVIFPVSSFLPDPEALQLREAAGREASWFRSHKEQLATEYSNRSVAVHGEQVVDSDTDLPALVDRFFSTHGRVGVYFGFVGERRPSVLAASV